MKALFVRTIRPEMVPACLAVLKDYEVTVLSTERPGLEFPGCDVMWTQRDYSIRDLGRTGQGYDFACWGAYHEPVTHGFQNVVPLAAMAAPRIGAILDGKIVEVDRHDALGQVAINSGATAALCAWTLASNFWRLIK